MESRTEGDSRSKLSLLWEQIRSSETATGMLLAVLVGLFTGLAVVGFREMINGVEWIFFKQGWRLLHGLGDYYVIILPAAGALVVGIIYVVSRGVRGEGPPEVIEAVSMKDSRIPSRVALFKAATASVCIGSGGSAGPEGPVVHIGGSIGSTIGRLLRLPEGWTKTAVLCGAAGGISAIFNAPLGGVLFALEVLQRRFIPGNLVSIVISSVTASFVAHQFLGENPVFVIPPYTMVSYWEILPYSILGIVSAVAGVGFVRLFYKTEDLFKLVRLPGWIKPALGGLVVGLIGLHYASILGEGYGGGYSTGGLFVASGGIDLALAGELTLGTLAILAVLKMVATSLTLGSGGSGGVFAPSFFIGSMLGGAFGIVLHSLFPGITADTAAETSGAYALVGMGAFFAATVHGPITAIILLFEMTRNYALILPLMGAVVFSTLVARGLSKESVYTLRLVRRGIDIHRREQADLLGAVRVRDVMTRDFPTVLPSTPVSELISRLHASGHHGFPMVDKDGNFVGVVTLEDVELAMSKRDPDLRAADIATTSPIVAYPGQSIHDALAQLGGHDVGRIPVVERDNPRKLVGVLRRHDIIRAYTKALGNHVVH